MGRQHDKPGNTGQKLSHIVAAGSLSIVVFKRLRMLPREREEERETKGRRDQDEEKRKNKKRGLASGISLVSNSTQNLEL